jgi:hypothetical protein
VAVASCVHHLLRIGVHRSEISLVTRHDGEYELAQGSIEFFQKNGDISAEMGGTVVGGVLGMLMGSLMGVASLVIPQFGLVVGAGPLMVALGGGIIGGAIGDALVRSVDAPYSSTGALHPYLAAIKEGDTLCAVEVNPDSRPAIREAMSGYATEIISNQYNSNA